MTTFLRPVFTEKKLGCNINFFGMSVRSKRRKLVPHIFQNRLLENHGCILITFVTRPDSKTGVNMDAMFLARPFLKM
jgi:pyridoxine 5'-phosphate synthase PdxJ